MTWFASFCGAVSAQVLLIAALAKLGRPEWFTQIVRNYRVLPAFMVPIVGRLLPATEAVVAGLLVLRIVPFVAGLAVAALFVIFAVAMAVNLLRGRSNMACGCFGRKEYSPLSWAHVVRNICLAGGAVFDVQSFASAPPLATLTTEHFAAVLAAAVLLACWWLGGIALEARKQSALDALT